MRRQRFARSSSQPSAASWPSCAGRRPPPACVHIHKNKKKALRTKACGAGASRKRGGQDTCRGAIASERLGVVPLCAAAAAAAAATKEAAVAAATKEATATAAEAGSEAAAAVRVAVVPLGARSGPRPT